MGRPRLRSPILAQGLHQATTYQYQAVEGMLPLRQTIVHKLQTENQISLQGPSQVVVTAGSNMGFMNAVLAITEPGDDIILQVPYYFNHEMAITMASCRAVMCPHRCQLSAPAGRHWLPLFLIKREPLSPCHPIIPVAQCIQQSNSRL